MPDPTPADRERAKAFLEANTYIQTSEFWGRWRTCNPDREFIEALAQRDAQTRAAARAEAFEECARVAETNHERSGWFIGRVIRALAQKETKP